MIIILMTTKINQNMEGSAKGRT